MARKFFLWFTISIFLGTHMWAQDEEPPPVDEEVAAEVTTPLANDSTDISKKSKKQKKEKPPKQHSNAVREMLNKVTFGFSLGYGRTFYKHDVPEFAVVNKLDTLYLIARDSLNIGGTNTAWLNWVNDPMVINSLTINATDSIYASDSTDLLFTSNSRSIPITLTVHYTRDRFRLGLGVTFSLHKINAFKPSRSQDILSEMVPSKTTSLFKKYFLILGYHIYKYREYELIGDLNIGTYKLGGAFNSTFITKGIYFNLGLILEKHLSEYLTVFTRASYEFKNYTVALPNSDFIIQHRQPAMFFQVGFTYRIPELPKNPLKSNHTQLNHYYNGQEYRSNRHPFWKWQDPKYGQNNNELIKYKGRNKRKKNPY